MILELGQLTGVQLESGVMRRRALLCLRLPCRAAVVALAAALLCVEAASSLHPLLEQEFTTSPRDAVHKGGVTAAPPTPALWRRVRVDNHLPRHQTTPRPDGSTVVNSHDPFLLWHNNTFFMWGIVQPDNCTGSPLCKGDPHKCGWGPNTFALHTSTDFQTWQHHTDDILSPGPGRAGVYCEPGSPGCTPAGACGAFLPKVVYNKRTELFVLWWTCATCSVATSRSPYGPWTAVSMNVTYADGKPVCHGSINLFVDEPSGNGYLVKNCEPITHEHRHTHSFTHPNLSTVRPLGLCLRSLSLVLGLQ
jgi:hypothetical protein